MNWIRELARRLRMLLDRRRFDSAIEEEMSLHRRLREEEHLAGGASPADARNAAQRRFGNETLLRERSRSAWGWNWLDTSRQDLRYALRTMRKNPGFTLVALLTLALGIGANTAIFSVIHAVLLRPLPYANPGELVTWRSTESQLDIDDIRAQNRSFSAGGGVNPEVLDYTGGSEPMGVRAGYVDAGLFQALGVPAMLGRTFLPEEDRKGGPRTVLLAYQFWRQYLSGDPKIIGKVLPLGGNSYTVIGVMPVGFTVPEYDLDLFVSLRVVYPEAAAYRGVHFMNSYWRLKPGVTLAQAAADLKAVDARLAADYPEEEKNRHTLPVPLQQAVTGDIRPALLVLFGSVCVVLLIACANFAGLLLARTAARRRELVIRAALGGGRGRLLRQSLIESTLLAILGGAAGLLVAQWGTLLLAAAKPAALVRFQGISVDAPVVAFGFIVSVLTGVIFGLVPAMHAAAPDIAGTLSQRTRSDTFGPAAHGFRRILVVSQMALALILLAGAGLLIKGFARLRAVDPGFNPARLVSIYIQLPATRYAEIPKQTTFRRELLDRLNAIPGVKAAMVGDVPLTGSEVTHSLAFDGRPPAAVGNEPEVDTFGVMGDYFRVMQIPVRSGRALTDTDREGQPLVAVINEALARQFYAHQNPIGQRIRWARETGPPRWMTIVGVVADVKQYSLAQPAYPGVFTPFAQSNEAWRRWMSVVLRLPASTAGLLPEVKRRIWRLDSRIPLNRIQSMDEFVSLSLSERRFNMLLLGSFAALAVLLAAVGLYGIISYSVSQRTHEFGIRMAVGARPRDVMTLVLGHAARLAAAGLVVGLAGAMALTRLMKSLLYGVTPTDPATLAIVVLLMSGVVLVAALVPARRATNVDPTAALRRE
ncbi:MAG TPA: ABC transporter permease [Bryobacteraceae bacterium]|nr:ABC transporter permease [Bryobacteraceae bacterium]